MSCTHTVTGATGNTGRIIAEILLEGGHNARVVGRSADRLQALVDKGAEAFVGSLDDADFLAQAYKGADSVYAMIPPSLQSDDFVVYADKISKAHVAAIREAGVKNVVALSSIGAHRPDGNGIVKALYHFEQDLRGLEDVNVLVLRPSYFMDNIYPQVDVVKLMGFVGSPVSPDVSQPVVHTRDIGGVAAARMTEAGFKGHTHEYILGERDISYKEITAVLGKAIGKDDLAYVQFPADQAVAGLQQFGMSKNVAGLIVELSDGINNGVVLEDYKRTPDNTTKTSIEEFAKEFAQLFDR
ncbi:MAG: NAD(P)H-binding protein [Candidatus Krumholzibacteria bacterium]|nr:NAD(P)H-binding protein [Candidatus Krumholzibacteria bacterium]